MRLVQFICKRLWAWHTCPADMRKDYKALLLDWCGMFLSAFLTVFMLALLLVMHNAML